MSAKPETSAAEKAKSSFTRERITEYCHEFLGTGVWAMALKLIGINYVVPFYTTYGLGLAMVVTVIYYVFGQDRIGHFNPSVTIAFFIKNYPSMPMTDILRYVMYVVAQFGGAMIGGVLGWQLEGTQSSRDAMPYVPPGVRARRALFAEIIFTFIYVRMVLYCKENFAKVNQIYGVIIGLAFFIAIACVGLISVSSLNSAVWLGCYIVYRRPRRHTRGCYVYFIGPLIGGALAALDWDTITGKRINKHANGDDGGATHADDGDLENQNLKQTDQTE